MHLTVSVNKDGQTSPVFFLIDSKNRDWMFASARLMGKVISLGFSLHVYNKVIIWIIPCDSLTDVILEQINPIYSSNDTYGFPNYRV